MTGVVADVHYCNLYGAPRRQSGHRSYAGGDSPNVRRSGQRTPVFNVKTMSMQIDDALVRERMVASLASGFGVLALVLAAVGL